MKRLLDQSWQAFDKLVPDASREPTIGSRMNLLLAALTLAMFRSLTEAGIEKPYAIELIADACWKIYQYGGRLGLFKASLFPRDAAERVRRDGIWPLTFPFNYPGYTARYTPVDKGIGFNFDVTCISFALHDMPLMIRKQVLKEMVRVTRTNGNIVIVDYGLSRTKIGRALVYRLVTLYEDECYREFIASDSEALLAETGIEILESISVLFGAARVLKGIRKT